MKAKPLNHVFISVSDLDRSIWFYAEMLGLDVGYRTPLNGPSMERLSRLKPGTTGRMALLRSGKSQIGQVELVQWDPPAGQHRESNVVDYGIPLLSFEVDHDELRPMHDRLTAAGIRVWSEPQEFELENYGYATAFIAEDPDGTAVELVALPSRDDTAKYIASKK